MRRSERTCSPLPIYPWVCTRVDCVGRLGALVFGWGPWSSGRTVAVLDTAAGQHCVCKIFYAICRIRNGFCGNALGGPHPTALSQATLEPAHCAGSCSCACTCTHAHPGLYTVTKAELLGSSGQSRPGKSIPMSISKFFQGAGRGFVHQPGQLPRFTAGSNRVAYQHPEGAAFWAESLSLNRLGAPRCQQNFWNLLQTIKIVNGSLQVDSVIKSVPPEVSFCAFPKKIGGRTGTRIPAGI